MNQTFVVGDVHGHPASLRELLVRLHARSEAGDTLVFLGDYIDRGPDSRGVVEAVLAERERWPGPVVTLKGNHEAALLAVLQQGTPSFFRNWLITMDALPLVGEYTDVISLESFRESLPAEHREFFHSLTLWHEDEHGIYVHAGLAPGLRPEACSEEALLWGEQSASLHSEDDWGKPVVFGHTPQYAAPLKADPRLRIRQWRPLNLPEKIGIDTGCGLGGPLTAVMLPEREFVSVAGPVTRRAH